VTDSGSRQGETADEFSVEDHEVTCRQFVELITDYFEGALGTRTLGQMEEHMVICQWCVTYASQMHDVVTSLRALREPAATAEPSDAVLAAVRARGATA
jgi:Putative zinc-finger